MTKWQNNHVRTFIPGEDDRCEVWKIEVRPGEDLPYKRYYLLSNPYVGVNHAIDSLRDECPYKQEILQAVASPDIYCVIEREHEFVVDAGFSLALPAILYAGEWEPVVQDIAIEPKEEIRNDG